MNPIESRRIVKYYKNLIFEKIRRKSTRGAIFILELIGFGVLLLALALLAGWMLRELEKSRSLFDEQVKDRRMRIIKE